MSDKPISITEVRLGPDVECLVLDVLRSGQLAQGPMVQRLEEGFREVVGTRHAVAVANGTVALVAALQALDLPSGTQVLTSPFTFVATVNAIIEAGLVARLVDIGDDYTLDVDVVDAVVGSGDVSAIMPVHLYGLPADMRRIAATAERHGLALVEDAAQAHGATVDGRPVGSFGVGSFSFYATKNLPTGEGGMVTTDDDRLADRLRLLRNQGMRARYQYEIAGHNYRMTDLQAAVGVGLLPQLAEATARRQANATALTEALNDIAGLITPTVPAGRTHVFHQYTVRVTPEARLARDELAAELVRAGIGTGVYYPETIPAIAAYVGHPQVVAGPVPVAERAATEVLSLPVHQWLTDADVDRIATTVRKLLG